MRSILKKSGIFSIKKAHFPRMIQQKPKTNRVQSQQRYQILTLQLLWQAKSVLIAVPALRTRIPPFAEIAAPPCKVQRSRLGS